MTSSSGCALAAEAVAVSEPSAVPVRSNAPTARTSLHSPARALMYVSANTLVTPKEIVSEPAAASSLYQHSTGLFPSSITPTAFKNVPLTLPVTDVNPLL